MKLLKTLALAAVAFAGTTLFAGEVSIKTNMTCESCKTMISEALDKAEGVNSYEVDLAANTVSIDYDDAKTNEASVTKTIADLGFKADADAAKAAGDKKACGTKKCCSTKKEAKK